VVETSTLIVLAVGLFVNISVTELHSLDEREDERRMRGNLQMALRAICKSEIEMQDARYAVGV
jgi:hypothetical protein